MNILIVNKSIIFLYFYKPRPPWVVTYGPRYTESGLRAENNWAHHDYKKNNSYDGLSEYFVSSFKEVRHRYILFVFMVCLFFFGLQSGLSISWIIGRK